MKTVKTIGVIIASVIVVIILQRNFGKSELPPNMRMQGESRVIVYVVKERHFANRIEAIGTARANEAITITSTVADRVDKILFKDGAQVKAGDMLVQLECEQERALLDEARINLAEQKREFERIKALREKKVVAEQAFDTQRSVVEAAEAQFAAAQAVLHDRMISAPFPGIIGIRQVSPGALINPGDEISTLDDLSIIKLDFTVPETYLSELKNGQAIEAHSIAWPDKTFTGKVTSVDSRVNPTTRAVAVQAQIENPDLSLRAGMLLTVELISKPRDSISVPEKALVAYAEKEFVYILNADNTVSRRQVQLGMRETGWTEILDGLSAGETIVTEGVINLRDGATVTVVEQDKEDMAQKDVQASDSKNEK
ncbi:MAG: efflux RND transporter periplasmic adaptor subunit [Planctomycetes bacterium]|nr:efflux RND transporter periplasmic adaptor subunit [Planctomycetota bacterium]